MKMLSEKTGVSNIKVLVLFSLMVIMIATLGVSIFAFPTGVHDDARGNQINITNISDANGNYLTKMNETEFLANTAFNITIKMNNTIDGNEL